MKKLITLFAIFLTFSSFSQIEISNIDQIDMVKKGVTYVAIGDPNSPDAQAYKEVLQKYWKLSELKFIKPSQLYSKLNATSSYLTIGSYRKEGGTAYFYLELWVCNKSFLKKKAKMDQRGKKQKMELWDKRRIARLELFPTLVASMPTREELRSNTCPLFQIGYKSEERIRNWGPGFLKNQVQILNYYVEQRTGRKLFAEILVHPKLKELKTNTLFIPEYAFIKYTQKSLMSVPDESQKLNEQELLAKYNYAYKVMSNSELNQKILNDTKGFYYLTTVRSRSSRLTYIVHSLTGEVIYTARVGMSNNLTPIDFEKIKIRINQ